MVKEAHAGAPSFWETLEARLWQGLEADIFLGKPKTTLRVTDLQAQANYTTPSVDETVRDWPFHRETEGYP
jgi:hypothetical protein